MSNELKTLRQIDKQRHLQTLGMYMPFLLPAFQMLIKYLVSILQIISGKYFKILSCHNHHMLTSISFEK